MFNIRSLLFLLLSYQALAFTLDDFTDDEPLQKKVLLFPIGLYSHIMVFGMIGMQLADEGYNVTMLLPANEGIGKVIQSLNHKINVITFPIKQTSMQTQETVRRWKLAFSYVLEPTAMIIEMMSDLFYSEDFI